MIKITEITGMEGDVVLMQDLFEYHVIGMTTAGKVTGEFKSTGINSVFTERMVALGYSPRDSFVANSGG